MKKRFVLYMLVVGTLLLCGAALAANQDSLPSNYATLPGGRTSAPMPGVTTPVPTPIVATPAATDAAATPKAPPAARTQRPSTPTPAPTPEAPAAAVEPNRIASYAARYAAYAAKHPEKSQRDVVLEVNLKLDQGNYEFVTTIPNPAGTTVFVSKHYGLPKGYKPENLVSADRKYAQSGVRLRKDCNDAFIKMAQAMEQEGLTLYIKSGYRTNRKRGGPNDLWYAWPGHSEHQTGLAFDLRKKNVTYSTLGEYKYHKTEEYAWLCKYAHQYGFILSYPSGKSGITGIGYEPWHWRYVGVAIATDMKEKGCDTYHEYWASYMIQDVYQ